MTRRSRASAAVVGYAQSPVSRHAGEPLGVLTARTVRQAVADAGLTLQDVDGFVTAGLFPTAGDHGVQDGVSTVSADWLASRLGVRPRYAAGFSGIGQMPGAVALAVGALSSGAADVVVLHRALHNPVGSYHGNAMRSAAGALQWTVPQGFFGPLSMIALPTTEYLQRHGATREDLAHVVVEARKNGARVPWSVWRDRPLTVEDYLAAPLLSDPICRFDCDMPVDSATAFVLTTAERARDLPHRPVHVAGLATAAPARHRLPMHWPLDDVREAGALTGPPAVGARPALGIADVDLPQLYDGFSPLRVVLARGARPLPTRARPPARARGGASTATAPARCPCCPAAAPSAPVACTVCRRCWSATCSCPRARASGSARGAGVAVACQSSPHFGGAVVYTAEEPS